MLYGKIAHNMIQVVFQLASEPATLNYEVPNYWSTEDFYKRIRSNLTHDFEIEDDFYIVSVAEDSDVCPEDHPPMLVSADETIEEYCIKQKTNLFYICLNEN
jgi:hypothetical protein